MPRRTTTKAATISPEALLRIEGWARDGLSNEQIAENLGIARSTLWVWAKANANIANALACGKDIPDRHVENALYKRALGWTYTEVTHKSKVDPETGEERLVATETTTKQVLPDTTAIGMWLRARKPLEWREEVQGAGVAPGSDSALVAALDQATADAWQPRDSDGEE